MNKVILDKATIKDLIPACVDHNSQYVFPKGYYVHKDKGGIYSSKISKINSGRGTILGETYKLLTPYFKADGVKLTPKGNPTGVYPRLSVSCPIIFKDMVKNKKVVSVHKTVMLSNIFYFNLLDEVLHKAFPHISLKDLKKTPRAIKEELLRGLCINHIDHNKANFEFSNLELVTDQGNAKKYEEFRKRNNTL
jgi:hypothetical protein